MHDAENPSDYTPCPCGGTERYRTFEATAPAYGNLYCNNCDRDLGRCDMLEPADSSASASEESPKASGDLHTAVLRDLIDEVVGTYYRPEGVRLWWTRPRHQLDGHTPQEVFQTDPQLVWDLAQGGREQTAT